MQCPICRSADSKWKNVDTFRAKPEGMAMCEHCGFISYPERYKSKAEIFEYYKKEYRAAPTINNIYTGERKIQYHGHFLGDLFNEWKKQKRKDIVVVDIGSAFGMFLNWVKHQLPNAEVLGVELTTSFVRNAWHLFQIKSTPELDTSRRYDVIASYKSLEHILDPDIELKSYIDSLKEDGVLYVSVPIWFETMRNFGVHGFDLETYYSPNHINTWTRKHFEGLIKIAGGEIIKENRTMYETAYLIKRGLAAETDRNICLDDPAAVMENLRKIFEAGQAFQTGDFGKVLETWPNCPTAWQNYYEMNRKMFHELGFEHIYNEYCQKALAACGEDADIHFMVGDLCARYDHYEKAIEHLNTSNRLRPNMPNVFGLLHNCFRALSKIAKDEETKVKFYKQARQAAKILGDISSQNKGEAMTWLMYDNAQIPTPFEALEHGQ